MMPRLARHLAKLAKSVNFAVPVMLAMGLLPHAAHAQNNIESQTSINSLGDATGEIFDVLLLFLPGVATLFLILSGYRYMVAQGNQDLVEKAKKSLTYAVVGVVVAYASVAIIELFGDQLSFGTL